MVVGGDAVARECGRDRRVADGVEAGLHSRFCAGDNVLGDLRGCQPLVAARVGVGVPLRE